MRAKALPLLALVLLTALTAALSVLAVLHVRPRGVTAAPLPLPSAASPTPDHTASAAPSPGPRTVADVRRVMATDDVDAVVLGDATGTGDKSWVGALAGELDGDRRVEVVTMADGRERTRTTGSGSRVLTLTNRSQDGLTLGSAPGRVSELVPAGTDLVVLSFGHSERAGDPAPEMDALLRALPADCAVLVVVQNPEKGAAQQAHRERMRALSDWAAQEKVPTADVFQAFTRAPEPLAELLQRDAVTPNEQGAALWARTVAEALRA